MTIYVVYGNGELICACRDYETAVKAIAEVGDYSVDYVEKELAETGAVDDYYFIDRTDLI